MNGWGRRLWRTLASVPGVFSGTREPERRTVVSHIDLPSPDTPVLRQHVTLDGWAVDPEGPMERVVFTVTGVCGQARPNGRRPDVFAALPDIPHAALSGFSGALDLSSFRDESVEIAIDCTRANGEEVRLGSRKVVFLEGPLLPSAKDGRRAPRLRFFGDPRDIPQETGARWTGGCEPPFVTRSVPVNAAWSYVPNVWISGRSRFVEADSGACFSWFMGPEALEATGLYFLQEELLLEGIVRFDPASLSVEVGTDQPDVRYCGKWMSLLDPTSENWMHFVSEILPRVVRAQTDLSDEHFGVLYDEAMPEQSVCLLQRVLQGRPCVPVTHRMKICVDSLLVHCRPAGSPSMFWPRGTQGTGWFQFDAEGLDATRALVRSLSPSWATESDGRLLYVVRKSPIRPIVNAEAVEAALVDLGFQVVAPGELDLDGQIEAFSNARIVVAQAGAALANMLFMPPTATVFCLIADSEHVNFEYFTAFADALGISLTYVRCPVSGEPCNDSRPLSVHHPMNASFDCPVDRLVDLLRSHLVSADLVP